MTKDKQDNHPPSGNAAADTARHHGGRSRPVPGVLRAALVALAVGPAIAAFVFVAGLPVARLARESAGATPASAKRPAKRHAESGAATRGESLRLLRLDETFWKSRLGLAKQEAISLAVDLVDSTATLDIRGVPVRECKIHRIEMSRALPFLENRSGFRDRLSKPLAIRREKATLPKEPIRVEIAPKDTTEANKAATRPLAPEQVDVNFTLFLDGHLALAVRQLEKPTTRLGFWRKTWMELGENIKQAGKAVRSLIRSELPQHELRIEVTLAREDAKAIYRALGPKARVALRL